MEEMNTNHQRNIIRAAEMKFFFVGSFLTAKKFLCGCNLRTSTLIISILTFLFLLISLFFLIYSYFPVIAKFALLLYYLVWMLGNSFVFIASKTSDFHVAYWGCVLYQIFVILWVGFGGSLGYLWGYVWNGYNEDNTATMYFVIFYYSFFAVSVGLQIYFAFMVYSFTKELGLGHSAIIDGIDENDEEQYQPSVLLPETQIQITENINEQPYTPDKFPNENENSLDRQKESQILNN